MRCWIAVPKRAALDINGTLVSAGWGTYETIPDPLFMSEASSPTKEMNTDYSVGMMPARGCVRD
jgi:hypothetical protein